MMTNKKPLQWNWKKFLIELIKAVVYVATGSQIPI